MVLLPSQTLANAFEDYATLGGSDLRFVGVDIEGRAVRRRREDLRNGVGALSNRLAGLGIGQGDVVLLALSNTWEMFCAFWSLQLLGATAGMVPPIVSERDFEKARSRLHEVANVCQPSWLITQASLQDRSVEGMRTLSMGKVSAADLTKPVTKTPSDAKDSVAVIQFTSGSTGTPRGCALRSCAFVTNARWILQKLDARPGDSIVSWLPTFHDMGLMSALILPVIGDLTLNFRPTSAFLRRPLHWIEQLAQSHRPHTAVPNFALGLVNLKMERSCDLNVDLTGVRTIACGAEPIHPPTVRQFMDNLAKFGLRQASFQASYGMAENTLIVSSKPGGLETSRDVGGASSGSIYAEKGEEVVNLGSPAGEVEFKIASESGRTCGDEEVGEILIRSPTLMKGYLTHDGALQKIDEREWFGTGDLGFMRDGEIFVNGRAKDLVIIAGQNIYPAEIETHLVHEMQLNPLRVAAFRDGREPTREAFCVVIEVPAPFDQNTIANDVRRICMRRFLHTPSEVIVGPRHTILRTTSGKIRRAEMAKRLLNGSLVPDARRSA